MNRFIHYLAATVLGATGLVAISGSAEAVITPPTCPSTTLTRTGAQTTALTGTNNGGTWDLTGATWTNTSLGYPVNATAMTNGCIKGGMVDGGVSKTSTRDEWYNGVNDNEPDNRDAYTAEMTNTSGNTVVFKNTYAEDFEDAYDTQTLGTNSSAYLDHVEAKDIGDDCIENEGSSSSSDVPTQHLYIKNSLFDGCFTGIGWRPGSTGSGVGGNSNASLTIEDTLMRISARPLGSTYCDSGDLSTGRCQSAPTSVSDSGMVGLYGLWKWSEDAPISSNVNISNTIFRVDAQSYSSCSPWKWPVGNYSNVTLVWAGSGSYNSLCSASSYPLPSGVTLTTDTSVWSDAVAAWRNGGGNPPPTNQAPSVNAGADQTTTLPDDTVNLNGTVSDDGLPSGSSVSSTWSKVSGPGTVTFGNPSNVDTTATFSTAGTYVLRLSATDGALTTTDTVEVVVNPESTPPPPPPTNQAPSVNAGADQTVTLPSNATLDGTVTDDGLPSGSTVSTIWMKETGPGTVTFGNANNVDTTATFSAEGTYVLTLAATDGTLSSSDTVTITVNPESTPPPPTNTAPEVSAGPDTTGVACGSDANNTPASSTACAVTLNGDVFDAEDGEVFNATWSVTTPSGLTGADYEFFDSGDVDTRVYFTNAGTYTVRLSYTDTSGLTTSDTAQVVVSAPPPPPPPPAGVTFVGKSFANSNSDTVNVPMPTGVQNGDKVVVYVSGNQGTSSNLNTPLHSTPLGAQVNDGSSLAARAYVHTVSSTSPTTLGFVADNNGGTTYQMNATAVAYRGVTTVDLVAHVPDANTDALHPVSGTTANAGTNLVFAAQHRYNSAGVAPPSTFTLDSALVERSDGGATSTQNTKHALTSVAGDTNASVTAGSKTYGVSASQASPYAISALLNLR